jgi:predicted transcriptional regulator
MGKVGRPKSKNRKNKSLTIRISDEMQEQLVKYASDHNMTMSAVALQALEKELSNTGK